MQIHIRRLVCKPLCLINHALCGWIWCSPKKMNAICWLHIRHPIWCACTMNCSLRRTWIDINSWHSSSQTARWSYQISDTDWILLHLWFCKPGTTAIPKSVLQYDIGPLFQSQDPKMFTLCLGQSKIAMCSWSESQQWRLSPCSYLTVPRSWQMTLLLFTVHHWL